MREIVNVQIGQCGNAVGTEFWELMLGDHGLNQIGSHKGEPDVRLERINVYFSETKGLRYTPRSVMIDLDKSSIEAVRSCPIGQIFKPENFYFGQRGTGNNWAKGHFSEGAQLCNSSLDAIRKEVEACDCFYGFQIVNSIGGGTGAGLGSLLMGKLKREYPHNMLSNYIIIPSSQGSISVVEPYNAVLTVHHLIENSDATFCIDNGALYQIAANTLKITQATYQDLNFLIALVMSGVTAGMRFPGPLNSSLRKVAVNMVPFPRLHFFVPSFAPIVSRASKPYKKYSVAEISSQIFDYKNLFASCQSKQGKFMTVSCLFRGEISTREVEQQMAHVQNRSSSQFVEWIPENVKTGICSIPLPGLNKTATFIGNTTSLQEVFKTMKSNFQSMFKRRAFLHWYTGEGLEEHEFVEAENNLTELLTQYEEYEETTVGEIFNKPCNVHFIVNLSIPVIFFILYSIKERAKPTVNNPTAIQTQCSS